MFGDCYVSPSEHQHPTTFARISYSKKVLGLATHPFQVNVPDAFVYGLWRGLCASEPNLHLGIQILQVFNSQQPVSHLGTVRLQRGLLPDGRGWEVSVRNRIQNSGTHAWPKDMSSDILHGQWSKSPTYQKHDSQNAILSTVGTKMADRPFSGINYRFQ